ncbi:hypothetical protein PMG11_04524 [Penicillium brasilianum]|uniref:Uncharacterized protein n=1 Tax=Penicillium brasilianum TaxID=104259 RepID=A0A0F7VD38_PENBI|nr:hypothetical protein PMG11_04524 [Penicillium brasilianum]
MGNDLTEGTAQIRRRQLFACHTATKDFCIQDSPPPPLTSFLVALSQIKDPIFAEGTMPLPGTDMRFHPNFSSLSTTMHQSDLDFVTYNRDNEIHDIRDDPILTRVVSMIDPYQAIVDGNLSLFRHRNRDSQMSNAGAVEENSETVFRDGGPGPLADKSVENGPTTSLEMMNKIREAAERDLILQEDGTYQCSSRGRLERLSEHQRGYNIQIHNFVRYWPPPDEMKKEKEAIEAVIQDLRDYEKALVVAIKRKRAIVPRLYERRRMIDRYLQSLSELSPESGVVNPLLRSREISPPNSIEYDRRGDIGYAISSEDSSTDQSSDEDRAMQDVDHDGPEEPGTDISPDIFPTRPQREETQETVVTLPNEPVPTMSPQRSDPVASVSLNGTAAICGNDADAMSTGNPSPPRRILKLRTRPTDEEKESGYKFIRERRDSNTPWDQMILEYNARYGSTSQTPRLSRKSTTRFGQHQSSADASPRRTLEARKKRGSHIPGPRSTSIIQID